MNEISRPFLWNHAEHHYAVPTKLDCFLGALLSGFSRQNLLTYFFPSDPNRLNLLSSEKIALCHWWSVRSTWSSAKLNRTFVFLRPINEFFAGISTSGYIDECKKFKSIGKYEKNGKNWIVPHFLSTSVKVYKNWNSGIDIQEIIRKNCTFIVRNDYFRTQLSRVVCS